MPGQAFLYPTGGAGLAGLFAAVLAHATVNSAAQAGQMKAIQTKADEVVKPYQQAIDALNPSGVLSHIRDRWSSERTGLPVPVVDADAPADATLILRPAFMLTQDRRAVIVDVVGQLERSNLPTLGPALIRVVSAARAEPGVVDAWAVGEGDELKSVVADVMGLAAQHLRSALSVEPALVAGEERTIRFVEGGKQVFQRARVLAQDCDRVLMRTLKDALMSAPLAQPPAVLNCPASAALEPAPNSPAPTPTTGSS